MKHKYRFTLLLLLGLTLAGYGVVWYQAGQPGAGKEEFTVVTSFYPMYIAAQNVIGEENGRVTLQNLSEPQTGCLHDYQLTPEDMKLLSAADVFIINGGGIETFLSEVAQQFPKLTVINAGDGIEGIEDNAHMWMSLKDYRKQVENIKDGLGRAFPGEAEHFSSEAKAYGDELEELEAEQETVEKQIRGENVVLFHEAYAYLAEEYGLQVCYTMDLDEERQISAGEVADVLSAIRENQVKIILAEELYGSQMGETVERESDAKVYYLDSLVRGEYKKDSYIEGMKNNIAILKEAFGVEKP